MEKFYLESLCNLFSILFVYFYLKFVGSTCHSDFFFKNQFLVVPENEMNMGKKLQLSDFVLSHHHTTYFSPDSDTTIPNIEKKTTLFITLEA